MRSCPPCWAWDNLHLVTEAQQFWPKAGHHDCKYSPQGFPPGWLRPFQPLPLPNPASFPSWVPVSNEHLPPQIPCIRFQRTQPATKPFGCLKYLTASIMWQRPILVQEEKNISCSWTFFFFFFLHMCHLFQSIPSPVIHSYSPHVYTTSCPGANLLGATRAL